MKPIDTLIMRPNRWYDRLPETRRFLTFLIPLILGQFAFGIAHIYTNSPLCYVIWYGALVVFGIWRWSYFIISDVRGDPAN